MHLSIVEVNDRPCGLVPFLSDKIELGDSDLKIMLKKHHEKRKHQPVRLEGWSVGFQSDSPDQLSWDDTGSHYVISPLSLSSLGDRSSMGGPVTLKMCGEDRCFDFIRHAYCRV